MRKKMIVFGVTAILAAGLAACGSIPGLEGLIDGLVLLEYGPEAFLRISLMRRGVLQISMVNRQGLLYHAVLGSGIDRVVELSIEAQDLFYIIL